MVALYEKLRPQRFSEVVGQGRALRKIKCVSDVSGLLGQVFAITGESGTGKTTLARLIAAKVADPSGMEEIDALDLSLDVIRAWQERCQGRPLFGSGYAFIVNEFHGLSNAAVSRLQTVLEDRNVQRHSTWCFTTTNDGQQRLFGAKHDALPFLSRAIDIPLACDEEYLLAAATHVQAVARSLSLDGKPLDDYLNLARQCKGNLRGMLQKVGAGEMLD